MAQIVLEIQINNGNNIIERRFSPEIKMDELKNRLELVTGASASTMELIFSDTSGNLIDNYDDSKCLQEFIKPGNENRLRLNVKDSNVVQLNDLSDVPKYVMSDDKYSERNESLLAFKMKNKLGRFAETKTNEFEGDSIAHIKVGDRCEVTVKEMQPRRGRVMYVGKIGNLPGNFVGVRYDEPHGKNDGTFENKR